MTPSKRCISSGSTLGSGQSRGELIFDQGLFYKILSEKTGLEIQDDSELMSQLVEMTAIKRQYQKLSQAYEDVQQTGYGIVMPDVEELTLEEPKILKQNGKYGIRLKATAPSIHMMKTQIHTEITPIVGFGAAVGRTGDVPAERVRRRPRKDLGIQYLRQVAALPCQ